MAVKKTLFLIPIILVAVAASAYFVAGNWGQLPLNTVSTTAQNSITSKTQTGPGTADKNVKSITIRLTNDGFDGTPNFRLNLKKGDHVKITFIYEDKLGDFHIIFIPGYEIKGPTLSPQNPQDTLEFIADETGTFGLVCLNANCKTHDKLTNALIVISE